MSVLSAIVAPGFFTSAPVHTALLIGGGAAIVSALVGVFTVIRGQSFAGHALSDISSAGGSVSFLLGVNPLIGFLGVAALAAGALNLAGRRRAKERDLATGIVLGAGLGLTALFLYLVIQTQSTTGAAISVMFGSMFAVPESLVAPMLLIGVGALLVVAVIYRPLLLCSLDADLAAVRGVPVRLIGLLHLLMLSLAVTLSAMTIGAILSTALLIGPAATALRLTRQPGRAILLAMLIGLGACWGGVLLAYDSYWWTPGHGWPVSFFIVTLLSMAYLLAGIRGRRRAAVGPAPRHTGQA